MKKILVVLFCCCLLLTSCNEAPATEKQQYTATFLQLFDTVTTVIGRDVDEASFAEKAYAVRDGLKYYHQLFDIYNDYDGIANIKTINDNAGKSAVKVDRAIIDLLLDCKRYCELTDGKVNVAMGSVLELWHDARSDGIRDPMNAALPDADALKEAAKHVSLDSVIISEADSTVFITDPDLRLDVGAVAKGWATQRIAESMPSGMLISVGGNVCATGPKLDDGTPWIIGIKDPDDSSSNLHTLYLSLGAVVTSGDYQRYYAVDGKIYHHIIDPETLMPAARWRSVSIICSDSGLADALSTGLFLMDLEDGMRLAEQCGVEVMWVDYEKNEFTTPNFESILRN